MGFAEGLRAGTEFGRTTVDTFESTRKLYEDREYRKQAEQIGAQLNGAMKELQAQQALKQAEMRDYEKRSKLGEVDEKEGQRLVLEFIDLENQSFSSMNELIMQNTAQHGTNPYLAPVLNSMFEANFKQNQGVTEGLSRIAMTQLEGGAQELEATAQQNAMARFEGTVAHEQKMQGIEGEQKLAQIDRAGMWDLRSQQAAAAGRGTAKGPKPINPLDVDEQVIANLQAIYGEDWAGMKADERRKAMADERRRLVEEATRVGAEFNLADEEQSGAQQAAADQGGVQRSEALTKLDEEIALIDEKLDDFRKRRESAAKDRSGWLKRFGEYSAEMAQREVGKTEEAEALASERKLTRDMDRQLDEEIGEYETEISGLNERLQSLKKMRDRQELTERQEARRRSRMQRTTGAE
jgi:hypothetical protein